jgi:hypothetical protein
MVSSVNFRRLRFLFFRLRRASFAEIVHRIRDWHFLFRLKKNPDLYKSDLPSGCVQKAWLQDIKFSGVSGTVTPDTLSRLLKGNVATLNHAEEAIRTFERKWQNQFFFTVNQGKADPDIRGVWEPARLQHLMLLLQHLDNGCNTADYDAVARYVRIKLLEWLDENPFPYGPHYMSVMECGLRIPVFLRVLLVLEAFEDDEYEKICTTIFQHGWLIRNRLSLYSSLGNHTVAECVGLIMAGALFREKDVCREWLSTGVKLLEQECYHQILSDGGPSEQSFSYHRFVLDLYWLAVEFLTKNGLHDCRKMKQRMEQGEKFLHSVRYDDEAMPNVGDSDDGVAVPPGLIPQKYMGDLSFVEGLASFPESGYTVFRNSHGLRILFDHGPLGMAPLYNHGHADALSVLLSVKGKVFFIDPGTFQYNGDTELRCYFKGTRAHNTVCIDGKDQAEQVTGFIWDKPFSTELTDVKIHCEKVFISANHNGYQRFKNMVNHQRELFVYDYTCCLIVDSFSGKGVHEFELNFHLHPEVEIDLNNEWLLLNNAGESIFVYNPDNYFSIANGQEHPMLGWYSPAYGVLQKTNTLQCFVTGTPEDILFTTLICFNENNIKKAIQIRDEFLENRCKDILC